MKLLKFFGLFVLFAGFNGAIELRSAQAAAADDALLELLLTTYDLYKDNFIDYIPKSVSLDECKRVLSIGQESLHQQMESLSYAKDLLFSKANIARMGVLVPAFFLATNPPIKKATISPFGINITYADWYEFLCKQFGNKSADYMVSGLVSGTKALLAFAGFSFVRDVKALYDKKDSLSKRYEKCTKMLALLEVL